MKASNNDTLIKEKKLKGRLAGEVFAFFLSGGPLDFR